MEELVESICCYIRSDKSKAVRKDLDNQLLEILAIKICKPRRARYIENLDITNLKANDQNAS